MPQKGGIIRITKRRVLHGMDLIIQNYNVLAAESPLLLLRNGLTGLTPEWYQGLVMAKGMMNGNKFNKKHPLYDSNSPPPTPPAKRRRLPMNSLECQDCGKFYKTLAALKGHQTRLHVRRPVLID